MTEKYLIEGSFLSEKTCGIKRMALETLYAIDELTEKGKIALIIPEGYSSKAPELKNIRIIEKGSGSSKTKWIYTVPFRYARKNRLTLINLAGAFPTTRYSIGVIADTRLREGLFKETLRWRIKSSVKGWAATHTAKRIVTISEFIKERIISLYGISADKITVIYCAWQHYEKIIPDESVFEKYPQITKGEYYYSVGSIAPHKNYRWIIEASMRNRENTFVVTGAMNNNIWGSQGLTEAPDNIVYTDYVSDEEMKALMMHAKAFIFPTLYEGFGIPPMEAMSVGVKCIVSDIPVMREVYGDSVHYINPHNADIDLDVLLSEPLKVSRENILGKYSWKTAAAQWLELMQ